MRAHLRERLLAAVADVLDSGRFILGPEVAAFEREAAVYVGRRPRRRRRERHRRPRAGAARARRGARRRGHLPGLHLLRHARGDRGRRRDAGLRRHRGRAAASSSTPPPSRPRSRERTRAVVAVHLYGHPAPMDALRAVCEPARHPDPGGRGAGHRRAPRRPRLRLAGRRGDVLVLPHEEPRRLRRRRPGHDQRRGRRGPRARSCASTARATSRRSSRSAPTRGSTSCRRRSCAWPCPSSPAGTPRAARPPTATRRWASASTSSCP